MQAMGTVDELNSVIGLMICKLEDDELRAFYVGVQHDLFNIGGEISMPGHAFIPQGKIEMLEKKIDSFNAQVDPLKDFILPGGSEAASICHIARATARRAERDIVTLHHNEEMSDTTLQYINRLSDLLFATARIINKQSGHSDVLWKKELA
jgi:cob(I)alamin adenosyltransferase